jgi:dihydroflavonol-4-reductase
MQKQTSEFWSRRPVAVTGGTGFLGHHVTRQLAARGAEVRAIVRAGSRKERLASVGIEWREASLNDRTSLADVMAGCEIVIHIAGAVDFESDWNRLLEVNVRGTENLLAAASRAGVRRVVCTSSIVAVGASTQPEELDETSSWNLESLAVPYVTSKRWAEERALACRELEVVVVNPTSVVGPDDFSGSEFGTLCNRFWRGRLPFHFGGGNNFVDVRDVATGHLLAAERGRTGERYILGGENRSYGDFFRALSGVAERPIFRLRLPSALGRLVAFVNARVPQRAGKHPYLTSAQARLLLLYFFARSEKARRELGYEPRPLRDSLADAHAFWMGRKSA